MQTFNLFSNVLHDWDIPEVKQLLQASFQALPSGGMLVVHDAFLHADKSGPQHVADYSVMLMHATKAVATALWKSRRGPPNADSIPFPIKTPPPPVVF